MNKHIFALLITAALLCGCNKSQHDKGTSVHSTPVKLSDYLFEITYTDYDTSRALSIFYDMDDILRGGACSVVRNGNLVGRNLDFIYCNMAEFIVHVKSAPHRYASVGVSSCLLDFTPYMAEHYPHCTYYDMLPYCTTDGINEKGVYCSINMAPNGDLGFTTGTHPEYEDLYTPMAVRYVLDHAATAEEACYLLQHKNLISGTSLGEMHLFIADANNSYVVETINNEVVCGKVKDNIMTNFYLLYPTYTPHACGIERYQKLLEHYNEGATLEGMCSLMQSVRYSLAYDPDNTPRWDSEFYEDLSHSGGIDITINTPKDVFEKYWQKEVKDFQNRKRDYLLDLWITTHTSVYNIQERSLRVYAQEEYDKHWDIKL